MKGFAAGLGRFALLARKMCDAPSRPRSVRTTTPDRFNPDFPDDLDLAGPNRRNSGIVSIG
jgi:hypothetical protein